MLIDQLNQELAERSRKNPRYSLRAFARSLDLSSSALSSLLNHKRPLTPKTAKRILDHLDWDERKKATLLMEMIGARSPESASLPLKAIDPSEIELVSQWEHYAILALLRTRRFRSEVSWIAAYFNLSTGVVQDALARLERHGLIDRKKRPWEVLEPNVTTTHDVPSTALRKAHRATLERAIYSLEHHGVEERDITGMTLTVPLHKLREAKRRIAEFRRSLTAFLEEEPGEEVYRLNIQLFPLRK